MSPAKNKSTTQKKTTTVKKTETANSKTKPEATRQGIKKKLNEFGDEDAL